MTDPLTAGWMAIKGMPSAREDAMVVGTDPSCDVRITDDPYVSLRHCQVWKDQQGVWVSDLGSTNGTWLIRPGGTWMNGVKVYGPAQFHPGWTLRVGRTEIPWTASSAGQLEEQR